MRNRIVPSLLLLTALSVPAGAQLIVGNDQSGTATIYNVNPTTGIATPIHSGTTTDAKPWGMAYDAATNTLYWNNGSVLFSSPLGVALTPTNLGTMMFGASSVNFVALGFHNGRLYGTRNIATEAVYEIDPVTLVATQSFVYSSSFDFGGLDWDASTGLLYGLTDAAPAPAVRGLYELDLTAQTATFVAPYRVSKTDIDGLAVANGLAYYVTDGPNTTQANFYVIDIASATQVGTIPSPFTGSGTFCAATWAGTSGSSSVPFCFGDGSGTACPCGNNSAVGAQEGCLHSLGAAGKLVASGTASIASDTVVLSGSQMPDSSALYFQGTNQVSGGAGIQFGDGLRCAGGTVIRLGTKTNSGGASQYPDVGDASVSVRGMIGAPGTRTYQVWYRNAADFCTPSTFNLTNGVQIDWTL